MQQLGASSRGVWTRSDALAVTTAGRLRALVASGTWQRPWPGVYADGGIELDAEQRAFAAVLATGGVQSLPDGRARLRAVACGRTAARVHGFVLIDDDDPATGARQHQVDEVHGWAHRQPLRAPAAPSRPERVLHRRELTLLAGDIGRTPSGLWLTSPTRTVVDCAGVLTHEALVCLLDDALRRELVALPALHEALAERQGDAGARALRAGLEACDPRAESPNETLARLLLVPHLPGLRPQVRVRDRYGQLVARLDLAEEELRLAVEMDGRAAHAGAQMVAKDRRRDRRTEGFGWWTERGTWWDVRRGQMEFVARVLDAATRRRRR